MGFGDLCFFVFGERIVGLESFLTHSATRRIFMGIPASPRLTNEASRFFNKRLTK